MKRPLALEWVNQYRKDMKTEADLMAVAGKFLNLLKPEQKRAAQDVQSWIQGYNASVRDCALAMAAELGLDIHWFMSRCGWEISPSSNSWDMLQWAWEITNSK